MEVLNKYTQIINRNYPEIEVVSARVNQDGQYNDVIILNEGLVFRFAKVPDAIKTFQYEVVVLKSLQGWLPLKIPDPIYTQVETDGIGEVFIGYPMINGVSLWQDNYKTITNTSARKRMAFQLAEFLKELHQFSAETIPIQLYGFETRAEWVDMYNRIQLRLYPFMREDTKIEVSTHFESYLDQTEQYGFEACLRHGDFGTGNILYDPVKQEVTGIIDFGGVGLGDPAVDFAGIYISYGSDFYENCCSVYPEMRHALDRVHFYCGTFALQEALFGVENNDDAAFQAGIADYV
jgi:aminoglycoside 2''-phosphotransferase